MSCEGVEERAVGGLRGRSDWGNFHFKLQDSAVVPVIALQLKSGFGDTRTSSYVTHATQLASAYVERGAVN
jgi:hypothetical protein